MSMFDPNNPFGFMPEIPSIDDPKPETSEEDIAASHIIGCLFLLAGVAVFFIGICLLSLIIYL